MTFLTVFVILISLFLCDTQAAQITNVMLNAAKKLMQGQSVPTVLTGAALEVAADAITYTMEKNPSVADDNLGYDFVFDITTLQKLAGSGWPVTVSTRYMKYLDAKREHPEAAISIVAVMGYYSKGKSFVVQEIFNAAHAHATGTFSTSIKDSLNLRTGPGVTTKGVSGIFAVPDASFEQAPVVILDMAGRNAPAPRLKQESTSQLSDVVKAMRLKERLVDEIAISVADYIVYVVDELLNEDQRILLHMLQETRTEMRFMLVHNFKRIPCDSPMADQHIKEQVVDAFGTQPLKFSHVQKEQYGEIRVFQSQWLQKDATVRTLDHVVIFNNELPASKVCNRKTFLYLAHWFMAQKPTTKRHVSNIIEVTLNATKDVLGRLVRAEKKSSSTIVSEKVSGENARASLVFRAAGVARFIPASIFDDLVPVPTIINNGGYEPLHEVFSNQTHFVISVEMPGFSTTDMRTSDEGKKAPHWFTVTTHDTMDHVMVRVQGNNVRKFGPPTSKHLRPGFGPFNLEFRVGYYFARFKLLASITDGVLEIMYRAPDPEKEFDPDKEL